MRKELLIGAGASREKKLKLPEFPEWEGLVTLDMNKDHKPDVDWNLELLPLPFPDNEFDEIHAYEVLEHTGQQGDWRFFFAQFSDFYRILKPDGLLVGTSPALTSPWLWGDPGHTRVISTECFVFLNQEEYKKQIGITPMTDYRFVFKGDFDLVFAQVTQTGTFCFGLKAMKPSRGQNG